MQFRILGPLEVVEGERSLDLGAPKQRAVLAILLVHRNEVVSLDRLIHELWGDEPPPRATGSLQAYVSNLRRALEPARTPRSPARVLCSRPPGYLLTVDPVDLDAARFESMAANGRSLLAGGRPRDARQTFVDALALWRGSALGDFLYADFARAERARLEELRALAKEDRIQAELALGQHAQVVPELELLLAEAPLRERLWSQLMVALYRSGRQADALRAFQECRRTLVEELGIEPSPDLRRLEADILAQDRALEWHPPGPDERLRAAKGAAVLISSRPSEVAPPDTSGLSGRSEAPAEGPPLVGREEHLSALDTALGQARVGRGRLVLVAGEAGIGKTRLVEEFAGRGARSGVHVAWSNCHEGEGAPAFWPWIQALRAVVASCRPEELATLESAKAAVSVLLPEWSEPGTEPSPPAADPTGARFRLYQAVTDFLLAASTQHPLLIVVEDLHWADVASLQLLEFVAPHLRSARILVVATYRDVDVDPRPPLADTLGALARQPVERMALGGLAVFEVGRFIASSADVEPTPALVEAIHRRTEGNPFFVVELVRLLKSERALEAADPEAVLRIGVPAGVRDVIRRRLGRLPEATNALLTVASVAGQDFDLAVLEAVGGLPAESTLEQMELGLVTGIIREHPDVVGRFRFAHALVRETLYEGLSALRRARMHARVGEALERFSGGNGQAPVADLAHHFWQAIPATGPGRALPHVLRAAEAAMAQLAYEEAHEQFRRAIQLLQSMPDDDERRSQELAIQLRVGVLLATTRGQSAPGVDAAFARASELCRDVGGAPELAPALWGQVAFSYASGRFEDARDLAERMVDMGQRAEDPFFLLAGLVGSGLSLFHLGLLTAARERLEHAILVSDSLDPPSLAESFQTHPGVPARGYLAMALALLGAPAEKPMALLRDAHRVASEAGDSFSVSVAQVLNAMVDVILGDVAMAMGDSETAIAFAVDHGFALMEAEVTVINGWAIAEQGRQPRAGADKVRDGLAAFEAAGTKVLRPFFYTLLAEAERRAGRIDRAQAAVEEGLAATVSGDRFFEPELHRLRGELLLATPSADQDEAEASLRRALALAQEQRARAFERRAAKTLADLAERRLTQAGQPEAT